jgi:hypothetical protein
MEIKPYIGVGGLFFSDNRKTIRKKLNLQYVTGIKGEDAFSEQYDYFEEIGLFVYYDSLDALWAFEFFDPIPVFAGANLLNQRYKDLLNLLLTFDPSLEISYGDFTSFKLGIARNTNDDADSEEANVAAVIIFKENY